MNYVDRIVPTREEWHAWRRCGIGSSDAAAIMDESPWSSFFELFLEKSGLIVGRVRARWEWKAILRGRKLEPEARASYENWHGVSAPAGRAVHPRHSWLRANCDGYEPDQVLAEFKCPGKVDHLEAVKGRIPKKYVWQLVHLMLVTGMPHVDYYSYRNGEGVSVRMLRDFDLEEKYLRRAREFWRRVETRTPPGEPLPLSNVISIFKKENRA